MSKNPKNPLKIVSTEIRRPTAAREAESAPGVGAGVQGPLRLSVEVENPSAKPLHVWASRRAYDYDSATHILTVYLTEHTPEPPPGIVIISNHPRTPDQVEVKPNSRATIDVPVPAVIRRRVAGEGLGMSFVEEPIGQIDRVELHIQSASEPVESVPEENPTEHRARLQAHGTVMRATVKPTGQKEG